MYVHTKLHVVRYRKTVISMLAVEILTPKRAMFTVQVGSIPAKGTVGGFPRASNNKLIQNS
jgi:hypothetical protein